VRITRPRTAHKLITKAVDRRSSGRGRPCRSRTPYPFRPLLPAHPGSSRRPRLKPTTNLRASGSVSILNGDGAPWSAVPWLPRLQRSLPAGARRAASAHGASRARDACSVHRARPTFLAARQRRNPAASTFDHRCCRCSADRGVLASAAVGLSSPSEPSPSTSRRAPAAVVACASSPSSPSPRTSLASSATSVNPPSPHRARLLAFRCSGRAVSYDDDTASGPSRSSCSRSTYGENIEKVPHRLCHGPDRTRAAPILTRADEQLGQRVGSRASSRFAQSLHVADELDGRHVTICASRMCVRNSTSSCSIDGCTSPPSQSSLLVDSN
jgi:hypothetical protein